MIRNVSYDEFPLDADVYGLPYLVDAIGEVPLIILERSFNFALSLPALSYDVTTK